MKKFGTLLLVLAMLLTLAGCGGASNTAADEMAAPMSQDMAVMEEMGVEEGEVLYSNGTGLSSEPQDTSNQKLIKRVSIDAETEDLDTLLTALTEQINELGGYVENQELYNGSLYSSYRNRRATLVIRIPAENLDRFVEQVQGASNVVNYNASQENVTLTYVATESRMNALKVEEERLLELLGQAENMADLLEIEARLTDVRYELESVTSQLRVLSNQVDYATVTLYLDQVEVYTEPEPETVWQRISSGFADNLEDIGDGLVDFFVWAVTYSPQLLFLAVLAALLIIVIRRKTQKTKVSKAPGPKQEPEEK